MVYTTPFTLPFNCKFPLSDDDLTSDDDLNFLSDDDVEIQSVDEVEEVSTLSDDDETATKLELAYAYQKMGDREGATENLAGSHQGRLRRFGKRSQRAAQLTRRQIRLIVLYLLAQTSVDLNRANSRTSHSE